MAKNKIYFKYGTMFSGKTLNLISTVKTYEHNKQTVLILKPAQDTRDKGIIKSRMSIETLDCVTFDKDEDLGVLFLKFKDLKPDIIFIDEVQFCTEKQIEQLHDLSKFAPIMCYGLKTSYTGDLFPSIAKLMAIAEDIQEIKTVCSMCKSKATHNLLLVDGNPTYLGTQINVENTASNEVYKAVCREHFYEPKLGGLNGE